MTPELKAIAARDRNAVGLNDEGEMPASERQEGDGWWHAAYDRRYLLGLLREAQVTIHAYLWSEPGDGRDRALAHLMKLHDDLPSFVGESVR